MLKKKNLYEVVLADMYGTMAHVQVKVFLFVYVQVVLMDNSLFIEEVFGVLECFVIIHQKTNSFERELI